MSSAESFRSETGLERTQGASASVEADPGKGPNLLFVCSSGHSGSTLLEMFLAGHPQMVAVGELHNFSHQLAIGRPCSCGVLPRQCPRWQAVAEAIRSRCGVDVFARPYDFRVSRERPCNLLEATLRNWNRGLYYLHFRGGLPARLGLPRLAVGGGRLAANTQLLSSIVRELSGARILIDSSKDYVRMRERHQTAAPGRVKVVYLHRDGRGVVWSSRRSPGYSIPRGAREWAKTQARIRRLLAGVRPEDRIQVRYEDLCSDPRNALQRICVLLGLEFSERMLELTPSEHHTIAGNKIRLQRAMEVRIDETWRRKLTPRHLRIFELIAGRENRRLGYA